MRAATVSFAVALAACTGDLARPELVADLRILAVRAEPPEGLPGQSVALDALVVSPDPAAPIALRWVVCVAAAGTQETPEACALAEPPTVICADDGEAEACLLGT